MAEPITPSTVPSRSDRLSLWATMVVGLIAATYAVVRLVARIAEVLPNRDVPVLVPFVDTAAVLPLGPDGKELPVTVDQAVLSVSDMPGITVVSLILAAAASTIIALIVIAAVVLFCRNLIAGRAFGRANTRLVSIAAMTLVVGWGVESLFTTMGVNGAFAAISDNSYENITFQFDFAPLFVGIALGAVAVAFQAGDRLQRDTEGLV